MSLSELSASVSKESCLIFAIFVVTVTLSASNLGIFTKVREYSVGEEFVRVNLYIVDCWQVDDKKKILFIKSIAFLEKFLQDYNIYS